MSKQILIRPLISEKAEMLSDNKGQYTFIVNKSCNKVEIRQAIESTYSVSVKSVNTTILPGKKKSRFTRGGLINGQTSSYKKAYVTLVEGEEIDFFGDI